MENLHREKLVSVIIPVYNVASYISRCLDSVLMNTYHNLEVICVDDGSTDGSDKILEQYARQDSRVSMIRTEVRGGAATARKLGLIESTGDYIAMVDADDWLHPQYFEIMIEIQNQSKAPVVVCRHQICPQYKEMSMLDKKDISFKTLDNIKDCLSDSDVRSLVWGRIYTREIIGDNLPVEGIIVGEDTLYNLMVICSYPGVSVSVTESRLYYYFMREDSVMHTKSFSDMIYVSEELLKHMDYFASNDYRYEIIKRCLKILLFYRYREAIGKTRTEQKQVYRTTDKQFNQIISWMRKMRKYREIIPYILLYKVPFLYRSIRIMDDSSLLEWEKAVKKNNRKEKEEASKIGILTFYCSDNYGAMLQAYGLKEYVKSICKHTEIIPYAPPFLTGRHWIIPYYPFESFELRVRWTIAGIKHNLQMGFDFFRRKKNMTEFRNRYLLDNNKIIRSHRGLEKTGYDKYIVGSDQIWNPDITFGLRKAYFGAFLRPENSKVVSYGASLGGYGLSREYENEMRILLDSVDDISLREENALPYIKKLTEKPVIAVSDPVFLLDAERWVELEIKPDYERYICVYNTERNHRLNEYAKKLAKEKGLKVVEIRFNKAHADKSFEIDVCAGPAEFLGYIHHADYVVTNSFHAVAFSIIFHKKFVAFSHSNSNARLENVLEKCGLQERLVKENVYLSQIDDEMCWEKIDKNKEQMVWESKNYLKRCLFQSDKMKKEN